MPNKPITQFNHCSSKKLAHRIPIRLLVLGVATGFAYLFIGLLVYFYPIHAQEPPPDPDSVSENLRLEEYACRARDPESFKACLVEARQTGVPFIRIDAPIICESRADCEFNMSNMKYFLKIAPAAPENKFIRTSDFGYTLFNIQNSGQIELASLTFEDESDTGCPQGTTCPPLISISMATNIKFDKVTFNKTQNTSVKIADSRGIEIYNSLFKDSYRSAIEISTANFTDGLRIENNTFENNAGAALIFQSNSLSSQSLVQNNKFINNHSNGAYADCTYPCTGAQIKINGPTSNLRIAKNSITGGINTALDSLGLYASGIEIAGQNIKSTSLYCNEITANRGSGIVQAPPYANITAVTISENKLTGNGLNLNIPTVPADDTNCYTAECTLACLNR